MFENNVKRNKRFITIEEGVCLLRFQNDTEKELEEHCKINSSFIQFHFCIKGQTKFLFNEGNYTFNLEEENSILLYNPQLDLPINLILQPNTWTIGVVISIKKFHSLFSQDVDHIYFLNPENNLKKYYENNIINPSMAIVLSQILSMNVHDNMKALYLKGKVYELLSLYFNKDESSDIEQCPFLIDENSIRRIRLAKEIILKNITEPLSLQELSTEIGLSLSKLKEGFKQLYGDTVFGYLLNHKMEVARNMLASNTYNVNEVGLKIGYSTSSHFIAAFKKKYGTTPKKYLMSLSSH